ncbi:MAG: response regulator transcription factor [Verrucomicrobiota bacterium]|nr:response regulator transcription factor [Verrucomicrobiota bacterium]
MCGLERGRLYKEIAVELGISDAAVRKHAHKIFLKFHVHNRSEAIGPWFKGNGYP